MWNSSLQETSSVTNNWGGIPWYFDVEKFNPAGTCLYKRRVSQNFLNSLDSGANAHIVIKKKKMNLGRTRLF